MRVLQGITWYRFGHTHLGVNEIWKKSVMKAVQRLNEALPSFAMEPSPVELSPFEGVTEAIDLRTHLAEFRNDEFLVRTPAIALRVHRRRLGVEIEMTIAERHFRV